MSARCRKKRKQKIHLGGWGDTHSPPGIFQKHIEKKKQPEIDGGSGDFENPKGKIDWGVWRDIGPPSNLFRKKCRKKQNTNEIIKHKLN